MARMMLSLCDYTTVMCQPWVEGGTRAVAVDVQHPDTLEQKQDGQFVAGWDILSPVMERLIEDNDIAFVAAFPPCTDLAVSGARWFKQKGLRALIEALTLVERCRELAEMSGAPWFIENPVSTISTYWRKPDHIFDPYEYGGYEGGEGDGYTKRTCLWTGGGFVMPEPRPIELDPDTHDRIHKAPPSPERANLRSATPRGFARAVWEANR